MPRGVYDRSKAKPQRRGRMRAASKQVTVTIPRSVFKKMVLQALING